MLFCCQKCSLLTPFTYLTCVRHAEQSNGSYYPRPSTDGEAETQRLSDLHNVEQPGRGGLGFEYRLLRFQSSGSFLNP